MRRGEFLPSGGVSLCVCVAAAEVEEWLAFCQFCDVWLIAVKPPHGQFKKHPQFSPILWRLRSIAQTAVLYLLLFFFLLLLHCKFSTDRLKCHKCCMFYRCWQKNWKWSQSDWAFPSILEPSVTTHGNSSSWLFAVFSPQTKQLVHEVALKHKAADFEEIS